MMFQVWINRHFSGEGHGIPWELVSSFSDWEEAETRYCICVKMYGTTNTMLTQDISPDFDIVLKEGKE